ncbi:tetratricopeptide repeat protein [Aquibacillus salsiterrae]|uniref:Tetratricopeptide repeat protein n=1 Tax=Aquibacillus salsiterrae TaxID=2950439 RepID=A0A9X3WFN6_9BACI|nr:tetratricopeptide repeat protein [Aquibacillus salsiterrae]MDC3416161.1 tetratricopeptide repeat protein [Aquibacillus salsiterrae]
MITTEEISINEKLDKVIPFIPEGDFYFTKGVEAFQKRKFDLALKWLKKAVELEPDEPLYQCQMSIIYTEIGAYHAANQMLTKVLAVNGDSYIDCYYLIANNYAHLGLLQDAKKYIETYLEKAPDGDFRVDAENLLTVLDISEDDEDDWAFEEEDELLVYQETAFFHLEREEWETALPLLEDMMAMFPEHVYAKHEYSFALFFAGNEQEALNLERKWLKKDRQSLFSHTNLAVFYHHRRQYKLRDRHIEALMKVFPIHEQQKLRIALVLARTGYYEEALLRFMSLPKSQLLGHISYYKWYSLVLYRVGQVDKAKLLWEEGCMKHPTLLEVRAPWI